MGRLKAGIEGMGMKFPHKDIVLSLASFMAAAMAFGPARPTAAQLDIDRMARELVPDTLGKNPADVGVYLDLTVQKLKEALPALKGLKYEENQDPLPSILAGVGKRIGDVLPHLPDLSAKEQIFHFQTQGDVVAHGGEGNLQPWSRDFRYLILSQHNADGTTNVEELRTDTKGRPAQAPGQFLAARGYGFTYQWLFFSPANQSQFRFRYLGRQDRDGRKTRVIAFAQDPAKVPNPPYFQALGKVAPFFYQGVLWVDESSFDIVRMRSDLLAPLSDLHLRQMTLELKFHTVPIKGSEVSYWLPVQEVIASDQGAGGAEETHSFSDYQLYEGQTKILPAK